MLRLSIFYSELRILLPVKIVIEKDE